ncbi:MAG: exodeoxyribonuclease V subunit gamma [Syntrophaceae bacterium]|nr:exodeoxyribonuclease V subunit gamma [Syntrophaceae bacterium]
MGKDQGNARILLTGDYPVLESSFVNEIKVTRAQDTFNPLLILVSSKLLGLYLRRSLADQGVSHFNLRFKTLEEFAREVSTPHLLSQGKTEIPSHADELLIGHIAKSLASQGQGFYFSDISDRQGFHRAIVDTIRDLRDACLSPGDIKSLLDNKKVKEHLHLSKLRDLIRLWEAYEERLNKFNWYDESDLMMKGSQWVKDSSQLKETPKILVYGFYDFNTTQKKFLQACFSDKETIFFLPHEPTPAFEFVKPAMNWLRENGFREAGAGASKGQPRQAPLDHLCQHLFNGGEKSETSTDALQIISAPGEPREVREVIRMMLQVSREKGTPLHEMGILLRSPRDYFRLFREAFDGLGIHPYLRDGLPLIETQAGRSLLLLLAILNRNFSRQSAMEFATFARLNPSLFPNQGAEPISPPQWDAISIQAGIVEGEREWEERLGRLKQSWKQKIEAGDGEDEEQRSISKQNLIALDQLIEFIKKLSQSLQKLKGSNLWSGNVKGLLEAFEAFIEEDDESLLVKQAIRKLSELDATNIPPSQSDFARLIEEVLEEEIIPVGRFQRNVPTVVNLMTVRGVPFTMVLVPGVVEKSFPPLIRQDAILLDHERKVLNLALSGKEVDPLPFKAEGRLDEERLLFRLAIGAAKEKLTLSFPRIEIGTGRERLPSSFLLATVKAVTGRSINFQEFEKFRGFSRISLSEVGVSNPEKALDEVEYDLSIGQREIGEKRSESMLYLREISPFFEKGLQLESSRWEKRTFTPFDGVFTSKGACKIMKERHAISKKSISPTRFEKYASCPYQYFLKVIMGIEALTEPEKVSRISPLDKGSLIHSILWRFFTDLKKAKGIPLSLEQKDLKRLLKIANEEFIKFEQMGVTGYPMLWEVEKKSILDDLVYLFNEELGSKDFVPTYFEVSYGMKLPGSQKSEISTEKPILITLGGQEISLRGRIDRIDLKEEEGKVKAKVIDYKSGGAYAKQNDFQGGTTLQLPLYLFASENLLKHLRKEVEVECAEYYHLQERRKKRHVRFETAELRKREEDLHSIIRTITRGIEEGMFIANPNPLCRNCDFTLVCGTWSRFLFDRKKTDPRVKEYLKMRGEEDVLRAEEGQA